MLSHFRERGKGEEGRREEERKIGLHAVVDFNHREVSDLSCVHSN